LKIDYARTCTIPISSIVADSATATGLKWAAPAGGGKVLQVVYGSVTTGATNSTNVYADTGLTATITPSATNSKVLVLVAQNGTEKSAGNSGNALRMKTLRGATTIAEDSNLMLLNGAAQQVFGTSYAVNVLDTPATTSATTYKTQFCNLFNGASVSVNNGGLSTIVLIEIGA
jgi:hypothetical protein